MWRKEVEPEVRTDEPACPVVSGPKCEIQHHLTELTRRTSGLRIEVGRLLSQRRRSRLSVPCAAFDVPLSRRTSSIASSAPSPSIRKTTETPQLAEMTPDDSRTREIHNQ